MPSSEERTILWLNRFGWASSPVTTGSRLLFLPLRDSVLVPSSFLIVAGLYLHLECKI